MSGQSDYNLVAVEASGFNLVRLGSRGKFTVIFVAQERSTSEPSGCEDPKIVFRSLRQNRDWLEETSKAS